MPQPTRRGRTPAVSKKKAKKTTPLMGWKVLLKKTGIF